MPHSKRKRQLAFGCSRINGFKVTGSGEFPTSLHGVGRGQALMKFRTPLLIVKPISTFSYRSKSYKIAYSYKKGPNSNRLP